MKSPTATIVIPCYNEEEVLPETLAQLSRALSAAIAEGLACAGIIVLVDDGSHDGTWALIEAAHARDPQVRGIRLSGNRGHQSALLAGLMTAPGDVLISMDADLQDDVAVLHKMLAAYRDGSDIVYGVRSDREADSGFKRVTAEGFYVVSRWFGLNLVFNHADFRLMSRKAIEMLRDYPEVNLFLRGMVPLIGLRSTTVQYARQPRFAGTSKYPLRKMLLLAVEGVTSLSIRPLRLITLTGFVISVVAFVTAIWAFLVSAFFHAAVPGWASTVLPIYFLGGVQMLSLGVIGEYIGKIYLETKRRPRYAIDTLLPEETPAPHAMQAADEPRRMPEPDGVAQVWRDRPY